MEQTAFINQSLVVNLPYTDDIQTYLDLITSQHKTKPKFNAWLTSALSAVYDGISATNDIITEFDIDAAVGGQLDTIGQIIGRSRALPFQPNDGSDPLLSDKNYRIALKAKISQNQWDGTIPSIYKIWTSLFSDLNLSIVDNQDMTMSALVEGQVDPVVNEMVAAGYIVPKPAGVTLTIIEVSSAQGYGYVGALVSSFETITLSTK